MYIHTILYIIYIHKDERCQRYVPFTQRQVQKQKKALEKNFHTLLT